ncbi:unnamed protein product [Cuscuta campestris]|uniref:Uncharacterized protein n=1 Tax=Cuscuta campestris TaxID=132261 RepID=A0A484KFL6_9ASTE|nr:unnamed protein product [Cuscuta campestris]
MMSSKLFLLLRLSLALSLLIASHVSGRDLVETMVHASSNTTGHVGQSDCAGPCKYGCCVVGYHQCCRSCCHGEAAAAAEP